MKHNQAKRKRKYPYYNDTKVLKLYPKLKVGGEEKIDENIIQKTSNEISLNNNLLNKKDILEFNEVNEISRIPDGNCFYRTISQSLFNTQDYHNEIRLNIYEYAKHNKDNFKSLILSDEDYTAEEYIEKIQYNGHFAGDLEIEICSMVYSINIYIYNYTNKGYQIYTKYECHESNEHIYIGFINTNHFYLLLKKNNIIKTNLIYSIINLKFFGFN